MTSLTVCETPFAGYTSQAPLDRDNYVNNGFWTKRSVQNGFPCFSSLQAEVISWRLLGVAALIGTATLVGLAAFEIVALSIALYAIPCLILSSYSFWYSTTIDDYENEEQTAQICNEAKRMTLNEVAERFEWHKIFQNRIFSPIQFVNLYRGQVESMSVNELVDYYEKVSRHAGPFNEYTVPLPREHASKWRSETQNKTVEKIFTEYPLEKLERLGMIDNSEMQKIRELLDTYRFAEAEYHSHQERANRDFEQTITPFRQVLDQSLQSIKNIYDANEAVRARQRFQHREMLDRLEIENGFFRRLHEAREQHQQRIAGIYPNGRVIAPENLSLRNREIYDGSVLELERNEQVIAQESRQRLSQHDAHYSRERAELDAKVARLREICDRLKANFHEHFRQNSEPADRVRQQQLQSHQERFQSISMDLDRIYRAYLRQLRTIY